MDVKGVDLENGEPGLQALSPESGDDGRMGRRGENVSPYGAAGVAWAPCGAASPLFTDTRFGK